MSRRPTITDIANAAGVSVATVSKAVNGRYGVAAETVEHVMQIVTEMGYESSLAARRMRGVRTGVIGVLVAEFEPFSAEILKGVGSVAAQWDLDLLAYSTTHRHGDAGWEGTSLRRLGGSLIDGAIIVTPNAESIAAEVPVVAVDPHVGPIDDVPTVEADSFGGTLNAIRYLIDIGHTRIGFVAGRPDLRSSRARDAGYRRALSDAGIPFDSDIVRVGFYEQDAARKAAISLLSSPRRPTAVFAANDLSAIGIIEVARELGLEVPRDLSVVGFDDVLEASRMSPPLTTVRQPMRRIGATAASLLVALMNGEEPAERHVRLATQLIARATTAPPPAAI